MISHALLLALSFGQAWSTPCKTSCPSIFGNQNVEIYQLYPENSWFDSERCLVYFSVLHNSTVAAYDPYDKEVVATYRADGLSGNPLLHASGLKLDPLGRLSFVIDAGSSFDTGGEDISGDNFLVKYDVVEDKLLWTKNLTAVTNGTYSGYQDIEHDEFGNTFVLGTFPSSIIRVTADGTSAEPWYLKTPANHSVHGFTGLAKNGNTLVIADNTDGQLYRMDLSESKGTPVHVPITKGNESIGANLDAAYLPPRYSGKVLLVSDNNKGTVVLRSQNGKWEEAENLGSIPNSLLESGGSTVASVQIGDTVYSVTEFFGDAVVEGSLSGNRTTFPLVDITLDVEKLLH